MQTNTQLDVLTRPIAARASSLGIVARSRASPNDRCNKGSLADGVPDQAQEAAKLLAFRGAAVISIASLTPRQKQVLDLILLGHPSKNIASDLGISQRTVENHRAAIAQKTHTKSLPALIHTAISARSSLNDRSEGQEAALSLTMISRNAESNGAGTASARAPSTIFCPRLSNNGQRGAMEASGYFGNASDVDSSTLQDIEAMRINMDEVQHRVKNMVAIILSISHQTMRQSTTKSDFDERFCARLSAFCRSLDLLIANNWRGVGIHQLVHSQLTTFGVLDGAQISIEGPELKLTPEAAHTIGLALHELATNAVKYGALSIPQGGVVVNWELANTNGRRRFRMTWSEFGGPIVTEPKRQGFGRQLIQQLTALALAGHATHEFLAKGVRWQLDIPASAAVTNQAVLATGS
jgi:two-component sensor histidine kinase